jgi:hypothetical protein
MQALMDSFDVRKLELSEQHSIKTSYFASWSGGHLGQLRIVLTPLYKEGYSRDLETDLP